MSSEAQNGILGETRAVQSVMDMRFPQKSSLASVRGEWTRPIGAGVIGAMAPSQTWIGELKLISLMSLLAGLLFAFPQKLVKLVDQLQ